VLPTAELDVHRVDTFRGELEAADLSPRSVNMILDVLVRQETEHMVKTAAGIDRHHELSAFLV
jgi:hypothetical protein